MRDPAALLHRPALAAEDRRPLADRTKGFHDRAAGIVCQRRVATWKEQPINVLDDYMVDPRLSLLDKTRIQAQVLVPVLRALRTELGKERADAIAKDALRDWSKQLFASVGERVDGGPRRKWAAMHTALAE